MPTWEWLVVIIGVVLAMLLADVLQRDNARSAREAAIQNALFRREIELLTLARAAQGVRYEIHLTEWPTGGWRWSVWDADAALYMARSLSEGLMGIEDPYACGNAPTKADAEAQALAEIAGLRLQRQIDEVFVA